MKNIIRITDLLTYYAAYENLCRLEGIFPSLEAAHALGILEKLAPTLCDGSKVVVNCSGSGDKDASIVFGRRFLEKLRKRVVKTSTT